MITETPAQIVLDTNFLISLLQKHRDPETEIRETVPGAIRIVVPDLVMSELERLARIGSTKVRPWANTAITLVSKRTYRILETKPGPTDVDASLAQLALTEKAPTVVATIDRQLRRVLESFGLPVIWPKSKYGLFFARTRR